MDKNPSVKPITVVVLDKVKFLRIEVIRQDPIVKSLFLDCYLVFTRKTYIYFQKKFFTFVCTRENIYLSIGLIILSQHKSYTVLILVKVTMINNKNNVSIS